MKKEKIYDFGELGKWSLPSLIANRQCVWWSSGLRIPAIEDLYEVKKSEYVKKMAKIRVKTLLDVAKNYDVLSDYSKLKDDYNKYDKVLRCMRDE